MNKYPFSISRRQFITGIAAGSACCSLGLFPSTATGRNQTLFQPSTIKGNHFNLNIAYQKVNFTGKQRIATAINGSIPAPTLIWKEGERVTLRVTNHLSVDSSIHWHGLILPYSMDGVPGLSFSGIKPGQTFTYSFYVNQSGTYWYHSHSGFQEQTGLYGAIIIEPKRGRADTYDREHVVMLSDWSDEAPENIYKNLKKMPHYYTAQERTLNDLYQDIRTKGIKATWRERDMWNKMRMNDRDISDVTGWTYTFLMNGITPASGWAGLFNNGDKVKLRFINAAAMTIFDVRIPGLKMTVVASDGQEIEPVSVDDFRIGVAETYDVIVAPDSDSAYCIFAQAIDRSGYARGTLSSDPSLSAAIPDLDPTPILTHRDMGMSHGDHTMGTTEDHSGHHDMNHGASSMGSGMAGFGSSKTIRHTSAEFGPHVDMRVASPQYQIDDPGMGLRDHHTLYGRQVLTYADVKNRFKTMDAREPEREIELHLTGNMSRYMWSINGIAFADAEPLKFTYGERLRINLINDTMMNHPIHLHGMWSELETGDADFIPRKHTVLVQPGTKISYLVTADAKGRWAYHCHLLYHMPGMFREVYVS